MFDNVRLASRPVEDVRQMTHDYAPEIVGLLTGW